MSTIPTDIYERTHELALAIVNASEENDDVLYQSGYLALRAYFDEQATAGRSHPFLTETVADYTRDSSEAIRLYQLALLQSRDIPDEPTHTKLIELAERLVECGQKEQAEACLRDGRAEAVDRGDNDWIEQANRLLHVLAR